ncbi:ABC transporter substrate-binding protein [Paenibacillus xerothermodurans]|uniref:ABC transporter substrate-binding protein n=2 Tax=Paenibacillus xerothermodurans TaxID=1977292 RepID=A0A2W1NCG6_PAEXE|nr:ABC transporter substrate-binding protein [Paenibacillus xerothermodurans]
MALGILSGCSGEGFESASKSSESGGSATGKDTVTLRIEVFDRGNAPSGLAANKNALTDYAQEHFGTPNNIKLEYVPVPRTQETEKLNVMLAANEAPDIVFTYDSNLVYKYVEQGGLTEVGQMLNEHGKNLKQFLGGKTLEYGYFKDGQYAIPSKRVSIGKYASFIRKDWLDQLGMPVPQSTAEVYNTLKAFKEKDPGNTGGQVVPLGFSLTPASYEPIIWAFIRKTSDEERITKIQQLSSRDYPTLLPGHKEGVQFLNKLYNEGLMSADFSLDKDKKKLNQDVMTGKTGMFSEDAVNPLKSTPGVYTNLQKNVQGAKLQPIDPFTNEDGKHVKPIYEPAGMYIMIPKSSKRAVEAIKYLDWMAQKDVLFFLQNGEEGKHYTMENGIPVGLDNEDTKNRNFNNGDIVIISNGRDFGEPVKNKEGNVVAIEKKEFWDDARRIQDIIETDGIPPIRFPKPIPAQVKYGSSLLEKYHELLVKSILAKPADFDKVYEAALSDYMSSGGEAILKDRQAAYAEMKK